MDSRKRTGEVEDDHLVQLGLEGRGGDAPRPVRKGVVEADVDSGRALRSQARVAEDRVAEAAVGADFPQVALQISAPPPC